MNKMPRVIKKNGNIEDFDISKIQSAINMASSRASRPIPQVEMSLVVTDALYEARLWADINGDIATDLLHKTVLESLRIRHKPTYESYNNYRDYKLNYSQSFKKTAKESERILYSGDKENANKDSSLNSTKQALIAESTMKELMRNFEIKTEWINAHDKGFIHIHDLGSRYLNQINCCLFDMGTVLKDGFEMNNVKYTEPTNIVSAWSVVGDVTLNASSQQYGGFSIPEIDTILSRYAEKSYYRHTDRLYELGLDLEDARSEAYKLTVNDIKQGYQGFEHKLNTISNALGQTPFVTITFGANTSKWGRAIAKCILEERTKGMGKDEVTAVFPKLVFLYRSDINGIEDSINYDIFKQAVECSKTRLYPDYLSFDSPETNNLADIYERTGKFVSPMGCRAYLSVAKDPQTGEEIYVGRNNVGAVSLNLPKLALEALRNPNPMEAFHDLILKYSNMVWEIHDDYYRKVEKMTGSTNPLLFCEGGSFMKVGYNESIKPIIDLSTASIGYVGLEEACNALQIKYSDINKPEVKKRTLKLINALTESAKEKYGRLFAVYGTPAESLIYRFQEINRSQYGTIEGVTDLNYMTNSFHTHVKDEINALDKIAHESFYHPLSQGGRITVTEFPYAVDSNVLEQSIKYAMSKGLYYGVNVVSCSCDDCGEKGEFECCPKCESKNITSVVRICGYLSFAQVKGDTRLNKGKLSETKDRVKHTYL